MSVQVKKLLHKFEEVAADRKLFEGLWHEIATVLDPSNDSFISREQSQGQKKNNLLDSTGKHCAQLLASGFFSMLTSPTAPWFYLVTNNEDLNENDEVKLWLYEVQRIMSYEMQKARTGFNTAMHESYLEYAKYGNMILYATERQDLSSLLYQSLPLSECFFLENDEGYVNSLIRFYTRTYFQLEEKFGPDSLHETVRRGLKENKLGEKVEVLHFMMPRREAAFYGIESNLPYVSFYLDKTHGHLMSTGGYYEKPFMVARFWRSTNEVYGRGPSDTALPDLKTLQEVMRTTLSGAQKMVDPPLIVSNGSTITPVLRVAPNSINWIREGLEANKVVSPLQTGGVPDLGMGVAQDLRTRIREAYYVDQLQLNEGPQMTATEVLQRTEEKLRLLGPVMGRAQSEFLDPLIQRTFGLLVRMGKLPDPPQAIMESDADRLKIIYVSPIAKALEQTQANNLTRVFEVTTPVYGFDPGAFDVINTDEIVREVGNMYALNPKFFRTEEEVAALREQRNQAAQEAQEAAILKDQGIGLNNLASAGKTLGESGGGGALAGML